MNLILRGLVWLDVTILKTLTLGKSKPKETISAAAWSLKLAGKWQGNFFVPIIDTIFAPIQADHCRKAYEAEEPYRNT